jgi:hypothetical protein
MTEFCFGGCSWKINEAGDVEFAGVDDPSEVDLFLWDHFADEIRDAGDKAWADAGKIDPDEDHENRKETRGLDSRDGASRDAEVDSQDAPGNVAAAPGTSPPPAGTPTFAGIPIVVSESQPRPFMYINKPEPDAPPPAGAAIEAVLDRLEAIGFGWVGVCKAARSDLAALRLEIAETRGALDRERSAAWTGNINHDSFADIREKRYTLLGDRWCDAVRRLGQERVQLRPRRRPQGDAVSLRCRIGWHRWRPWCSICADETSNCGELDEERCTSCGKERAR